MGLFARVFFCSSNHFVAERFVIFHINYLQFFVIFLMLKTIKTTIQFETIKGTHCYCVINWKLEILLISSPNAQVQHLSVKLQG